MQCSAFVAHIGSASGHLQQYMAPPHGASGGLSSLQVVTQRLMKLETKGSPVHLPAEVIIRRRKRVRTATGGTSDTWEMVRARGHLDEVEELKAAATTTSALAPSPTYTLPPPLCDRADPSYSAGLASVPYCCTCSILGRGQPRATAGR